MEEETFPLIFWLNLSQLSYERCKDIVDKLKMEQLSSTWTSLLNIFNEINNLEKAYMDLLFMHTRTKGFLRKDNSTKTLYEHLRIHITKLQDVHIADHESSVKDAAGYAKQFIEMRIKFIELYEKIYAYSVKPSDDMYTDLKSACAAVLSGMSSEFLSDESVAPIRNVLDLEIRMLLDLFEALLDIQKLDTVGGLTSLYSFQDHLADWETRTENKDTWKLGFLKREGLPPLLQWMMNLKAAIVSKMALYSYEMFSEQTTFTDIRHISSKLLYDGYQKVVTFQRRYEPVVFMLLSMNVESHTNIVGGTAPIIFAFPSKTILTPPSAIFDGLWQMLKNMEKEFQSVQKVHFRYNTEAKLSYVVTVVEKGILILLVFEQRKTERDNYICDFMLDLCACLRCTTVFSELKTPPV